jgi:hypothetical protein
MDRRLETIRLVTARYEQLKGLRLVLVGVIFATTFGAVALTDPQIGSATVQLAIVVTLVMFVPCQLLLDRYYRSKFGTIVKPASRATGVWFGVAIGVTALITDKLTGSGPLTGALIIAVAQGLWIAIRDWPLRAHHLLGCLGAAGGVVIQFTAVHGNLPRAQAIAFLVVGLAYIPVGLLDHRLLTSVMRPAHRHGSAEAPPRRQRVLQTARQIEPGPIPRQPAPADPKTPQQALRTRIVDV